MSLPAVWSALSPAAGRLTVLYLAVAAGANLAWETAQLPLYTVWRTGTDRELAFFVAHCTAGDVAVLAATFLLGLLLAGDPEWPTKGFARVALTVTLLGTVYTSFSEWRNVEILRNWAYAPSMPLLPPFGTGLAPFLQWAVIPPFALAAARRLLSLSANGPSRAHQAAPARHRRSQ